MQHHRGTRQLVVIFILLLSLSKPWFVKSQEDGSRNNSTGRVLQAQPSALAGAAAPVDGTNGAAAVSDDTSPTKAPNEGESNSSDPKDVELKMLLGGLGCAFAWILIQGALFVYFQKRKDRQAATALEEGLANSTRTRPPVAHSSSPSEQQQPRPSHPLAPVELAKPLLQAPAPVLVSSTTSSSMLSKQSTTTTTANNDSSSATSSSSTGTLSSLSMSEESGSYSAPNSASTVSSSSTSRPGHPPLLSHQTQRHLERATTTVNPNTSRPNTAASSSVVVVVDKPGH